MKKRTLTLLEIMIVIFLITLITGTIGYSMRGTLDKGRAFRTEQGKQQLQDLLLICLAEGDLTAEEIANHPVESLKKLGLAKNPDKLVLDGWKQPFSIKARGRNDFNISSEAFNNYKARMMAQNSSGPSESEDD